MSAPIKWSGNDNYSTPGYLLGALDHEFGFDLDPCPLAPEPEVDGLGLDWSGRRVFLNPPWSRISPWVDKALESGAEVVVMVLPARTDTGWFHRLKDRGAEIRLFRKRMKFVRGGVQTRGATDGTLVAVLRPLSPAFAMAEARRTWRIVVHAALDRIGGRGTLPQIYSAMQRPADRASENRWWRPKVRQVLGRHFKRVGPSEFALP